MSIPSHDKLTIHANVQISAVALQTIVANAKKVAPRDGTGSLRVDTADWVSQMISRFLEEKDFENYVKDSSKYLP
ncbi:MAG: hypothetical protein HZB87_05870 [Desulfatitalea sp.]|nr:hypothetical protein [Desulfatitalea sp.]MBI5894730.1 hypothetical protein [Desulfobacterales bacterium]